LIAGVAGATGRPVLTGAWNEPMLWKPLQKIVSNTYSTETTKPDEDKAYLVRSNPSSSSSTSSDSGADVCFAGLPFLKGLREGAGLLLGGRGAAPPLIGLESRPTPFMGVFPNSAYFQKGAGELVGMCWLGR